MLAASQFNHLAEEMRKNLLPHSSSDLAVAVWQYLLVQIHGLQPNGVNLVLALIFATWQKSLHLLQIQTLEVILSVVVTIGFCLSGISRLFPSGFNIFNVLYVVTLSQSKIMLFEMAHVSYANTTKALKLFGHADWSEISI